MPEKMKVAIVIDVDDKGVTKITHAGKEIEGMGTKAGKATSGLGRYAAGIAAVGAAIAAAKIVEFGREAIDMSAEQQKVFVNLGNTLDNVGIKYNDVSVALQGTLGHLQDVSRFGDTDTATALDRLVGITGDYELALQGLQPVIDFAVGAKLDLKTASELAGKAIAGQMGTLSRYGIVLDKATQEMLKNANEAERAEYIYGLLSDRWGGAAAAEMDTYAGKVQRMSNYWGDFQETAGNFVTMAPGVSNAFDGITVAIQGWTEGLIGAGKILTMLFAADLGATFKANLYKMEGDLHLWVARQVSTLAKLPKWMGGGKAQEAVDKDIADAIKFHNLAMEQAKIATDGVAEAVEEFEAKMRNLLLPGLEDTAGGLETVNDELDDMPGKAKEAASKFAQAFMVTGQSSAQFRNTFASNMALIVADAQERGEEASKAFIDGWEFVGPPAKEGSDYERTAMDQFSRLGEDLGAIQGRAISDGILGTMFGEDDAFFTAYQAAGERSATAFIDAFIETWGGGKGFEGLFEDLQGMVDSGQISAASMEAIGTVVNYASAALAAYQSWDKPMSPTERGMLGAQVGSAAGPWGAAIGGALGFIHGMMTDYQPTQIVQGWYQDQDSGRGPGGTPHRGRPGSFSFRDYNLEGDTNFPWHTVVASMNESLETAHQGYLSVFQTLGEIDLILAGGLETFSLNRIEGDDWRDQLEQWISEEIPQRVFGQMREGLETGLRRAGFEEDKLDDIFAEAAGMTGQQLIDFMNNIAQGAVAISQAVTDTDLGEINRVMGLSGLQMFGESMTGVFEEIDLLQARMVMSLSAEDQAIAAGRIADLIQAARTAEIQMLMQIQAMQDGINASIAGSVEALTLGGMDTPGQQNYFINQMESLLSGFGEGMSPEDIQSNTSNLLGYMGDLVNSFEGLDMPGIIGDGLDSMLGDYQDFGGAYLADIEGLAASLGLELDPNETFREFFIRAYEAIQGVSDTAFQDARENVEGWADRLNQEANDTADALFQLGEATRTILNNGREIGWFGRQDENQDEGFWDTGDNSGGGGGGSGGGGGGGGREGPDGVLLDPRIMGRWRDDSGNTWSGGEKSIIVPAPVITMHVTVINHVDGSTEVHAVPYATS